MTYRPRTHGFVLVAVLATLVILTTIAGTIALIAQGMVERELASQRMLEGELEEMDTRTSVLYVLLTQRMTFGGLTVDEQVVLSEGEKASAMPGGEPISFMPVGNEIRLDGTVYEGIGGARFALQDDRGRIAVNWMPSAVLAGFLGDASDTDPQTLVHLLADYQDPDDSYRINSAEQAEYLRRGMPPPRNQPLATPLELRRVMGWAEALALRTDEELVGSLGVDRSSMLNVNTAPVAVLASLPGIDEAAARRVVASRRLQPFMSLASFYQLVGGIPADEDFLALYPASSGTLATWAAGGGSIRVLHWTLTPLDDGGRPWREDYELVLSRSEALVAMVPERAAAEVLSAEAAAEP
jgi:general secretion pathway protein K